MNNSSTGYRKILLNKKKNEYEYNMKKNKVNRKSN